MGDVTVKNCIIWGNGYDSLGGNEDGTVSYSDIEGSGGSGGGWDPCTFGTDGGGNIDADPCFVDPCESDYHLSLDSPCFNAGDPNYNAVDDETDIDGDPRVMRGRIDMGADEFDRVHNITQDKWYAYIEDAVYAANAYDEIEAYPDTYKEISFTIDKPMTVRSTDPNDWDVIKNTIIDIDYCIFMITGADANSILKGFTIENNDYSFWGAVLCWGTNPTISRCIFRDNIIGVHCQNSASPLITNSIFHDNSTGIYYQGGGSGGIENNLIYGNQYGIKLQGICSPTVRNDTIIGNADYGIGKVGPGVSTPSITNCILWDNGDDLHSIFSAAYSCIMDPCDANGIGNITADPTFMNHYDFWDVTTADGTTSTIEVADASLYDINDIIEYGDDSIARLVTDVNTTSDIVVFTAALDSASESGIRIHNWDSNTDVVENYHLQSNSPCIDVGDPNGVYTGELDIDFDDRVIDIAGKGDSVIDVDMGADEYKQN
jgi:hypothetical protein